MKNSGLSLKKVNVSVKHILLILYFYSLQWKIFHIHLSMKCLLLNTEYFPDQWNMACNFFFNKYHAMEWWQIHLSTRIKVDANRAIILHQACFTKFFTFATISFLYLQTQWLYHHKILHMTQQHCCWGTYIILRWPYTLYSSYNKNKFTLNVIFYEKSLVRKAPSWSTILHLHDPHHTQQTTI